MTSRIYDAAAQNGDSLIEDAEKDLGDDSLEAGMSPKSLIVPGG